MFRSSGSPECGIGRFRRTAPKRPLFQGRAARPCGRGGVEGPRSWVSPPPRQAAAARGGVRLRGPKRRDAHRPRFDPDGSIMPGRFFRVDFSESMSLRSFLWNGFSEPMEGSEKCLGSWRRGWIRVCVCVCVRVCVCARACGRLDGGVAAEGFDALLRTDPVACVRPRVRV